MFFSFSLDSLTLVLDLQGSHGDLTSEESQILLAEFCLRHSDSAVNIACEYAKRKSFSPLPKL